MIKAIITGCGVKPIGHIYKYKGKPTHCGIPINGKEYKMNIGTAVSYFFAKKGVNIIMVSRNEENLLNIQQGLISLGCNPKNIEFIAADITTEEGIKKVTDKLSKKDTFYWVQSIGMGGGSYSVPNDNIYLPFEKIEPGLIAAEMDIVTATHRFMLKLIPIFRKQIKRKEKSKITIITSMSGERGYHFGATHVAAKHALVGYIKGIEKELEDEGIEIHDVRPGGIDTGMYDNDYVRKSVETISQRTQMRHGEKPMYANPLSVAKKVYDSMFGKKAKKIYRILGPKQK